MVTQIQLGNIYQQNGRTVLGGSQSAIDTQSLIDGLAEVRRLPAVALEDKIKINDSKIEALTSLKDILARFQDAADLLRNPPGVGNSDSNIFAYRSTSVVTNAGADASAYLSVTAEAGANIQGFSVDVITQLAKETKQNSNTFSLPSADSAVVGTTPAAGMFTAGTFALRNVTGGAAVSVTFEDGDSLQTVANKMNAVKEQTGIQATVLKVANGSPNSTYRLAFSATETGTTYGFDLTNPATVTSDPDGVWTQMTITTPQTAQNAQFTVDGAVITRESNSIDDLIEGMTFTLRQPTPLATTLNVQVRADTDSVKQAITNFADIYNEFRVFAAEQTKIGDDGIAAETAVLNNNTVLSSAISSVAAEISRVVAGIASGDPSRLADVGISFVDFAGDSETPATKNIMQIDPAKLTSALEAGFDGVAGLFQFRMTSDNSNLAVFSRTNALDAVSMTLSVDRTNGVYTASYVDTSGITRTANLTAAPIAGADGVTLTGEAGTGLEGLVLIYASNADDLSLNVTLSQGIGDRVFNALEAMLEIDTGTIDTEIEAIVATSTRHETEISRIDERITLYRDQLQTQYAALESALTRANQILQVLDAQAQARNSSS